MLCSHMSVCAAASASSSVGASPQRRANGKKGGRNSAGAMNLLANAAEDNEAYENPLTHAQLQQLQQHLLQQQFQVNSMHVHIIS